MNGASLGRWRKQETAGFDPLSPSFPAIIHPRPGVYRAPEMAIKFWRAASRCCLIWCRHTLRWGDRPDPRTVPARAS